MTPSIQIVILAGGLGTRLGSITQSIPKALVPILGKPFIDHQIQLLKKNGIHDIIFSTGHLSNQIQDYVQNGERWGVRVQYVDEGANLRGTGGALRFVFEQGILNEKFLLTYGDSYLPIDYQAVWQSFLNRREPALMTVLLNQEKWDTSNVCFNGSKVTLYDKKANPKPESMRFIDFGLLAFDRSLVENRLVSGQKSDLADLLKPLSVEGLLSGYELTQRFYEIGSHQGILDLEEFLKT